MEYDKNYESDILFYEIIKNEMILIMNELNQNYNESDLKNIKEISNILQYMIKKKKENKFYINSNCEDFFKTLKNQIIKAKNYVEENFKENLEKCFFYFDMAFNREINEDNSINLENLRKDSKKIIEELKAFESKYKLERIFDNYYNKIIEIFKNIAEDKQKYISKYNKDISELIKKELEEKINNIFINDLNNEIEKLMKELDSEFAKNKEQLDTIF
jgi:BMFP domain-containing protein YqiC